MEFSTDAVFDGYDLNDLQDPYYPRETTLEGPVFLDTEACLCALQETPAEGRDAVWQCIGNQTQEVYEVSVGKGKWFKSVHGGNKVDLPYNDASNPPNTNEPLKYDSKEKALVPLDDDDSSLTIYDKACTGINQTTFTTAYLRAFDSLSRKEYPLGDVGPCWRPGAVPIPLVNESFWQSNGCPDGFLCQNNTINSLPQYCPPLTVCQKSRVSGAVCSFDGVNMGMGPFEPVICQTGHYCPTEDKGRTMLPCPAGSYCQPGAATPTPCPEGSSYARLAIPIAIPIAILIILDVALLLGIFLTSLRNRFRSSSKSHNGAVKKPRVTVTGRGYKQLPYERDDGTEMAPMQATYVPRSETWMGFEAALAPPGCEGGGANDLDSGLSPQLRVFVESMKKATDGAQFGLSFRYSDLSFHPKSSSRPILQNITGSIERGSLVAVMGGSGAGKSTFVNVLMGKSTNTGGSVIVNNTPRKIKRYKKLIELTVYENILHAARIRLPRTWADVDIQAHVNSVIDCLELSHVRDSLVGSIGNPVISGGQRKRASIGMELAAAPMAIFLDEPRSGLDATAAVSIMRTLKAIARLGISVIVIIHQPRMEIFELLDDLILLGNGQIIYEGPESEVQPFFENIGFHFPEHSNYGDVVTDIITGNGRPYKRSGDISKESLITYWASSRQNASIKKNHASLGRGFLLGAPRDPSMSAALKQRGAPRFKKVWLCFRRAMLQQWRAKSAFWFEMGLASLAGFLLGLAENSKKGVLFVGIYNKPFEDLSVATDLRSAPEFALLIAIAIGLVAGAPGVKVFSEELLMYRREAEAGHSRIAYFLAKAISVIPRMLFACMHFSTLILLLALPVISWGIAFVTNLAYFYCIYGLASCVSMIVRREEAPLFATMVSLIVGILSGSAPPLSQVKKWHLEWLWRLSPGVWLAEIYFGQLVEPFGHLYDVGLAADLAGFQLSWMRRNILILLAIGTVYRIIAFVGLVGAKRMRI
ncbi:uncharacterized protein BCR38DRAFT_461094 [Pseudomassariella vexata]|uniref:ABC transporter domain-containing protein n=1 Tax=Pseudomassariella vexata TaxID=1141098 RepID=A0A1Y2DEX4_9PEZI|nr:uncharacterized protein BCR38DRAFT_461094 [Pseudomassariella vexata]ORY57830.1 hypothetical protein BCR38DRAFT_461094 [Pseudomassariella vexata]